MQNFSASVLKRFNKPVATLARKPVEAQPLGEPVGKGEFNGCCNRQACMKPLNGNNWWNKATQKYYCQACAYKINGDNNLPFRDEEKSLVVKADTPR